jgi:hypothetical protein
MPHRRLLTLGLTALLLGACGSTPSIGPTARPTDKPVIGEPSSGASQTASPSGADDPRTQDLA